MHPKVVPGNLFRMLEYAYRLQSFHILSGTIECNTLEDVYDRLAGILAHRILDRVRSGLYRSYVAETADLPYLRGSLDVERLMRAPWGVELRCHYEENTLDVEENQILAWTLFTIARQGMCREETTRLVRSAFRALNGTVTLHAFDPRACIGRLYNRLNDDYRQLHALCRFFLEQSGPGHETGDRTMLPFLVNMGRLYELFVAEWLKEHLSEHYRLVAQESVSLDTNRTLSLMIDLVIYDRITGQPLCVLDTKYKTPSAPSPDDRDQIIAYAAALGGTQAALIYPVALEHPFDGHFGASGIHLRTLKFGIEGELEAEGRKFLKELLEWCGRT
jgi:5-methylcytosine-specific restriction enzyme subunit McrC